MGLFRTCGGSLSYLPATCRGSERGSGFALSDTRAHVLTVCYFLGGGRYDPRLTRACTRALHAAIRSLRPGSRMWGVWVPVCVCVRARVCGRVRACACVRVCVLERVGCARERVCGRLRVCEWTSACACRRHVQRNPCRSLHRAPALRPASFKRRRDLRRAHRPPLKPSHS